MRVYVKRQPQGRSISVSALRLHGACRSERSKQSVDEGKGSRAKNLFSLPGKEIWAVVSPQMHCWLIFSSDQNNQRIYSAISPFVLLKSTPRTPQEPDPSEPIWCNTQPQHQHPPWRFLNTCCSQKSHQFPHASKHR